MEDERDDEGDLRGSRFITGALLIAGFTVLGMGIGLLIADPGTGLFIGSGAGLAAIGFIRAARGL